MNHCCLAEFKVFQVGALDLTLLAVGVLITLSLAVAFVLIMLRKDAAAKETEPGSDSDGP